MKPSVHLGEELGAYGFPHGHPFGPDRMQAFRAELDRQGLLSQVVLRPPVRASDDVLARFHSRKYIEWVKEMSERGVGYLDEGDTPAFPGCHEAAATVVGTTIDALERIMGGECKRAFAPIAGLHHARRERAGGFCIYNDCGVAIETLLSKHGLGTIAYVDIDAHHGDGVYYAFESEPRVLIADIHEDGRFLYPGTGSESERGLGAAAGTKLNITLEPDSGDRDFAAAWQRVEAFLDEGRPEFILLQCGADGLDGDPLTHLRYSSAAHEQASAALLRLAERHAKGRLLAMGGGGYDRGNIGRAWSKVVEAMISEK